MNARGEPVVVTGMGVVCGLGRGFDAFWRGLLSGRTAIGDFDAFDHSRHRTHVAAAVPRSASEEHADTRSDRFAVEAALEAVRSSGADLAPSARRVGVYFGSSTGGLPESEEWFFELLDEPRRARARQLRSQTNNGPGDAVARRLGVRGPVETVSSACTSGSLALLGALRDLRAGVVDVAIAGGADALSRVTYAGFNSLRSVDPEPCRPFRRDRRGLSLGEGAAVLVLETAAAARERGTRALAVLVGAAATCDAQHMSAPDPSGAGAARAIRDALREGGRSTDDVDFINAHGTGTPHNDSAEWSAMRAVFGARAGSIPLTATKAMVGHLLGSCGALEAAATVASLAHAVVPPVPDDGEPDPELPVDLVRGSPRRLDASVGLSTNLAFGGTNTALVFARVER